ncbi:MAG: GH1 family beta-glucosidase [Chloroflexota bacterium]
MSKDNFLQFPDGFHWGTATSAYQIEGGVNRDGRGKSIWDTFSHTPGKIRHGHTGDVAADHYCRWQDDVNLMAELGYKAYRFSVAWPRIQPAGMGAPNTAGLDFYDRLVDGLLDKGITPFLTLYHWDLPQALQDQGGWANRETAFRFAEYAGLVAERLGDRVLHWTTLNEPFVAAFAGNFLGEHAPGIQDAGVALATVHNLLLGHGLAVPVLRAEAGRPIEAGITLNLTSVHPHSDDPLDHSAAQRYDAVQNRLFLDALMTGKYPDLLLAQFGPLLPPLPAEDFQKFTAPIDFLGINYYNRTVIRHDPDIPLVNFRNENPTGNEYTLLWEIYPQGLYEVLTRVWRDYHPSKLFVTENGAAMPDGVDADGRVRDVRRTRYIRDHLVQCHRAIQEGVPLQGYFAWSLMDNFEWAYGYEMRFWIVYVDFASQQRIVKDSGRWFSEAARRNGFDLHTGTPYFPC